VDDVKKNKNQIAKLAEKYGGVSAGEKNGERGYLLTFTIGYLRVFKFAWFPCFCKTTILFERMGV
jgi:hypothetical protein